MCPEFREGVCEIAGIEPKEIKCVGEDCCISNDWECCKVYTAQFFLEQEGKLAIVA